MASWHPMTVEDIQGVMRVADEVHPDLPERDYVFKERVKLFPEGCLVLLNGGEVCGYAISHPISQDEPPQLDSLLGDIAPDTDQYYIHDIAILPSCRKQGYAADCVNRLLKVAKDYSSICLISVYGTAGFWSRFGFVPVSTSEALSKKLYDYGDNAKYLIRGNPH